MKTELNGNKYKFGLNDYKLNSNWTKNISFGSSIWAGSSTKLMLTTEIPGKSTHYNQVFVMQTFLISLRKETMKEKSRFCCLCFTISFSENNHCRKCFSMSTLVITSFRTMLSSFAPWMNQPWRSYQALHIPDVIFQNSSKKQ